MFTQLKKNFNSTTMRGRANVAKATYGVIALLYLFMRMRRKKALSITADCQKNCSACTGAEARENCTAVEGSGGAATGATSGAAVASAATTADSNGNGPSAQEAASAKTAEKSPNSVKTEADKNAAGKEPRKPCKRVEPKDITPLEGHV